MSIVDIGFSNFIGQGDAGDLFGDGGFDEVESVSFADTLLSRIPDRQGGSQSLFTEATGFAKSLFGLADTGLQLFGHLNARTQQVTGEPLVDFGQSAPPPNAFGAKVAGVPVWVLVVGGVAVIWLATK